MRIDQAIKVTMQRPGVSQEMVRKHDRLRTLQVRVSRQVRITGLTSPIKQDTLKVDDTRCNLSNRLLGPQSQIGCNLIITATRCVQTRPSISGNLGNPSFNCGVDVFIAVTKLKRSSGELLVDGLKGIEHALNLIRRQDTCTT
tara:strand:+ start:131 stop:559 length:429 start_codon:yes stop_codon:yes gene_type:complete